MPNNYLETGPVYSADPATAQGRLEEIQAEIQRVQTDQTIPDYYRENLLEQLGGYLQAQQAVVGQNTAQGNLSAVSGRYSSPGGAAQDDPEWESANAANAATGKNWIPENIPDPSKNPYMSSDEKAKVATWWAAYHAAHNYLINVKPGELNTANSAYDTAKGSAIGSYMAERPDFMGRTMDLAKYYYGDQAVDPYMRGKLGIPGSNDYLQYIDPNSQVGAATADAKFDIWGQANRANKIIAQRFNAEGVGGGAREQAHGGVNKQALSAGMDFTKNAVAQAEGNIDEFDQWAQNAENQLKTGEEGVRTSAAGDIFGNTSKDLVERNVRQTRDLAKEIEDKARQDLAAEKAKKQTFDTVQSLIGGGLGMGIGALVGGPSGAYYGMKAGSSIGPAF